MSSVLGSVSILNPGITVNIYQRGLAADDLQIWSANTKIQQTHDKICAAKTRIANAMASLARTDPDCHPARHANQTSALERANRALEKARNAWNKEVEQSRALVESGIGSGRVSLVYSSSDAI